ncbi:MAG: hypothetical protein FWG77_07270 [Treponema sp.]|nr:hypothetical protein [Treponema sp.]
MLKITSVGRNQYIEKTKPYRDIIQTQLKKESAGKKAIERGGPQAAYSRLALVDDMLYLASNYLILCGMSQAILRIQSEESLNEARKSYVKAITYLEEIVSPFVDVPYSDYEDKLSEINDVDAQNRYALIRRAGLVLNLIKDAYGENAKWKWSFVDLEGRYAAVAKNIMNLKTAVANTDPRAVDYEPTVNHIRLIKKLLANAADRYREKYELLSNHTDDFNMGINFLNALKRIHNILGEKNDAETIRKKADTWAGKLDMDVKQRKKQ